MEGAAEVKRRKISTFYEELSVIVGVVVKGKMIRME